MVVVQMTSVCIGMAENPPNQNIISGTQSLVQNEWMHTYFTSTKNIRGAPLTYVIHKTQAPSVIVIDREQDIIQNAPLQGNIFSCGTNKVLVVLKDLIVHTDAYTWIKGGCCSRELMLVFQNNYDGKSEEERRKRVARDDLKI